MPVSADAILQDRDGRSVLRFERALRQPPERVWSALVEPGEQRSWHPTPFEFEPAVGGAVTYLAGGDVPEMPSRGGDRVRAAARARPHLGRRPAALGGQPDRARGHCWS